MNVDMDFRYVTPSSWEGWADQKKKGTILVNIADSVASLGSRPFPGVRKSVSPTSLGVRRSGEPTSLRVPPTSSLNIADSVASGHALPPTSVCVSSLDLWVCRYPGKLLGVWVSRIHDGASVGVPPVLCSLSLSLPHRHTRALSLPHTFSLSLSLSLSLCAGIPRTSRSECRHSARAGLNLLPFTVSSPQKSVEGF